MDDECLNLEINNFETWNETAWMMNNQACGRRCQQQSLGATTAAELCPTVAISLEQPLTVEAHVEEETPEAGTLSVTPEQSGEDAAELTPSAALVEPIGGLTIDRDTETWVPSPAIRASVSATSPPAEISPTQQAQIGPAVKPVLKCIGELEVSPLINSKHTKLDDNLCCLNSVLPYTGAIFSLRVY